MSSTFTELPTGSILSALLAAPSRVLYVSKDGNDSTATGSFNKPYLTVTKALSTITTATGTDPYWVIVGPGSFTETAPFSIKDNVAILGSGMDETTIASSDASLIRYRPAAAGSKRARLHNLTISGGIDFTADPAATVAATLTCHRVNFTGSAAHIFKARSGSISDRWELYDCLTGSGSFTQNGGILNGVGSRMVAVVVSSRNCSGGLPSIDSTKSQNYNFTGGGQQLSLTIDGITYVYTTALSGAAQTAAQVATDLNTSARWSPSKPVTAAAATASGFFTNLGLSNQVVNITVDSALLPNAALMTVNASTAATLIGFEGTASSGLSRVTQTTLERCTSFAKTISYYTLLSMSGGVSSVATQLVNQNARAITGLDDYPPSGFTFQNGATQANNLTLNGNTKGLAYTPTAGVFTGTAPTSIFDAVERLAALVKTLNGGTGA